MLVLGITFKENIADVRNSQVPGMVAALEARGIETDVHDPLADAGEVERRFGIRLLPRLEARALTPACWGPWPIRLTGRSARRPSPACSRRTASSPTSRTCGGTSPLAGRAPALDAVSGRRGAYRGKSRSIEAGSSAKSSITASAPRSCGGVGL